ncbi:MAG: hypothetical protein KGK30_05890 [Elusimicrobia bacterium]|nr:hypothetical protein [Elusimicrobiota bacterium]
MSQRLGDLGLGDLEPARRTVEALARMDVRTLGELREHVARRRKEGASSRELEPLENLEKAAAYLAPLGPNGRPSISPRRFERLERRVRRMVAAMIRYEKAGRDDFPGADAVQAAAKQAQVLVAGHLHYIPAGPKNDGLRKQAYEAYTALQEQGTPIALPPPQEQTQPPVGSVAQPTPAKGDKVDVDALLAGLLPKQPPSQYGLTPSFLRPKRSFHVRVIKSRTEGLTDQFVPVAPKGNHPELSLEDILENKVLTFLNRDDNALVTLDLGSLHHKNTVGTEEVFESADRLTVLRISREVPVRLRLLQRDAPEDDWNVEIELIENPSFWAKPRVFLLADANGLESSGGAILTHEDRTSVSLLEFIEAPSLVFRTANGPLRLWPDMAEQRFTLYSKPVSAHEPYRVYKNNPAPGQPQFSILVDGDSGPAVEVRITRIDRGISSTILLKEETP